MRFNDTIPYSEEMLATITNTNIDIVRSAMQIFTQLGMIEVLDNGTIYMSEVQKMIGSAADNENAIRQQRFRDKKKEEKALIPESVTKSNASITEPVTNDNESKSIEKEKEKEKELDKELDIKESKPKNTRFVPPTVDEVQAYCDERGNDVDAQRFVDYYTARGWRLGKNTPVKDWKACVRTWERNSYGKPLNTASSYNSGGNEFTRLIDQMEDDK